MTSVTPDGSTRPVPSVDVVRALRRTYLFADTPPVDLESIARRAAVRRLQASEAVYRVGDRATHLYVLVNGELTEGRTTDEGEEHVEEVFAPGGVAGEPGLFAAERDRVVDLVATTPATVVAIARDDVVDFLGRHPAAMLRMFEGLAADARAAVENLVVFGYRTVRERVAYRLCELAATHGEADAHGTHRFRVHVTQRVVAGLVAARRENVNRAIASLKAAGLVAVERDEIVILDLVGLRSIVGPDRIGHRRNQRRI